MRTVKRLGAYSMLFLLLVPMAAPLGWQSGRVLANAPHPKIPSKIENRKSGIGQSVPANVAYKFQGHLQKGQTHVGYGSMTIAQAGAEGEQEKADSKLSPALGSPPSDAVPNQSGITASVTPTHGVAGSSVTVSGTAPDQNTVRILMRDCDFTKGLAEAPVSRNGRFSEVVTIPRDASLGTHGIIIVGGRSIGPEPLPTREVPFTIDPPPPIRLSGTVTVRDSRGRERPEGDVIVRVYSPIISVGSQPSILAETVSDRFGKFGLDTLYLAPLSACLWVGAEKPGQTYGDQVLRLGADLNYSLSLRGYASEDAVFYGCREYNRLSGKAKMFATIGEPAAGSCPTHLGNFVSMPGRGAPVINTFKAALPFTLRAGDSVQFLFSSGGNNRTFNARRAGSLWIADVDMSEFPPGEWSVEIRISPTAGCGFEPNFVFTMIEVPWFNPWVTNPRVQFKDDHYEFSGLLPKPAFDFNEPLDLGLVTLDNIVTLGIPTKETLSLGGKWTGQATAAARVTFVDFDLINEMVSYNPSGNPYVSRPYAFKLPTQSAAADTTYLTLFKFGWGIPEILGIFISFKVGLGAGVNFDSTIKKDLKVNVIITPNISFTALLSVEVDLVVCGADVGIGPRITLGLPIYYDPDCSPVFGFDDPCVKIDVVFRYEVDCFWIEVASGEATVNLAEFGCGPPNTCDPSKQLLTASGNTSLPSGPIWPDHSNQASAPSQNREASLKPQPSVASDGAGHALAIWLDDPSAEVLADRQFSYSYYDGARWSPPQRLNTEQALVDHARVAFLRPNRALAVWMQNKLSHEQAHQADVSTLMRNGELYYALWNGRTWSAPAPITNNNMIDVKPSLAANPATGRAMVVWVRTDQHTDLSSPPLTEIYYASFDGTRWSQPARLAPRGRAIDYQPSVQFDRRGQAVALWLRDTDGNLTTREDRQLLMSRFDGRAPSGWTAPEAIPNLPAGAYSPSFAFDKDNNPIVVFVVPSIDSNTGQLGSGDGNSSELYAAYRRSATWEGTRVGRDTFAERPVVKVNPENRAIIMYRQFGTTPDVHVTGDVAAAVAGLNASPLQWTTGFLTADGLTNWQVAFDVDGATSQNFILNVKKTPGPRGASKAAVAEALARLPKGEKVGGNVSFQTLSDHPESVDALAQNQPAIAVASYVVPYAVDLALTPADIAFSNPYALVGETVTITATVRNAGLKATSDRTPFTVKFYEGDPSSGRAQLIGEQRVENPLPFNTTTPISVPYTVERAGIQTITVIVDEENAVAESDQTNNRAQVTFGQPPAPLQVFANADLEQKVMSLGWTAPETRGIDHYEIFRSTTAGRDYEFVGDTTATEFVDTLVRPGVTYYYVVVAVDIYGARSAFSNEATGQLP